MPGCIIQLSADADCDSTEQDHYQRCETIGRGKCRRPDDFGKDRKAQRHYGSTDEANDSGDQGHWPIAARHLQKRDEAAEQDQRNSERDGLVYPIADSRNEQPPEDPGNSHDRDDAGSDGHRNPGFLHHGNERKGHGLQ